MSIRQIGPIAVTHYDPSFSWTSSPAPAGMTETEFSGNLERGQARRLRELVNSPTRRTTVYGIDGVLELVWDDTDVSLNGLYLLRSCGLSPDFDVRPTGPNNELVPFSLSLLHLGQVPPRVIRSDRARAGIGSLDATPIVAVPFTGADFVTPPGGTRITRQYDPDPHDPARVDVDVEEMVIYVSPTARSIPVALQAA